MIVWINGPFGGGKSALSAELLRALPGAVVPQKEKTCRTPASTSCC
ncbi:hypothetical protein GA0115254_126842 [Streptomyces sp. Ncost-T10-10d]|nr:hypothetical protein GA0115254_126842 [Streptomyces sp. Ncost-T10-10d]